MILKQNIFQTLYTFFENLLFALAGTQLAKLLKMKKIQPG